MSGANPIPQEADLAKKSDSRRQYNPLMLILRALLATLLVPGFAAAQEHVSFPTQDGGVVYANLTTREKQSARMGHRATGEGPVPFSESIRY